MPSTVVARYVGPHSEGVKVVWQGRGLLVEHGEWTELPAALVHGTKEHAGLLAMTELVDPATPWGKANKRHGERAPVWELQGAPKATRARRGKSQPAAADGAGVDNGEQGASE